MTLRYEFNNYKGVTFNPNEEKLIYVTAKYEKELEDISKRNQNLTMINFLLYKIVEILISYLGQLEDESIEIFLY